MPKSRWAFIFQQLKKVSDNFLRIRDNLFLERSRPRAVILKTSFRLESSICHGWFRRKKLV